MDLSEPTSERWWIPDNENAVVYGTVEQSDDGIHLEAIDPFELAPEPAWGSDVILPIIHGETVGGDAVTLISCRRTKWSAMTRGPERWRINATVTDNLISASVPRWRADALRPTMVWRSAAGKVLRVVRP